MDVYDNFSEQLTEYFKMLCAGLAGNPHMVGATILALSSVLFNFKGIGWVVKKSYVYLIIIF